jgi:hypothetical protein
VTRREGRQVGQSRGVVRLEGEEGCFGQGRGPGLHGWVVRVIRDPFGDRVRRRRGEASLTGKNVGHGRGRGIWSHESVC